eukprot:2306485-Prymnesium_polylepis.1
MNGMWPRLGPRGDGLSTSQDDPSAFCRRAGDLPLGTSREWSFYVCSLFCVSHVIICATSSCGARAGMQGAFLSGRNWSWGTVATSPTNFVDTTRSAARSSHAVEQSSYSCALVLRRQADRLHCGHRRSYPQVGVRTCLREA